MTRAERVESRPAIDLASVFAGAKAGDEEAVGTFYERAKGLARRWVKGDFPDAEDVVEAVAAKATGAVGRFEPPQDPNALNSALMGWVSVIVRNERTTVLRRKQRFPLYNLIEPSHLADTDESATAVSSRIDNTTLQEALIKKAEAVVRPFYFEVVKLSLEGKSDAQIASELGITESNVRIRRFRGRKTLASFFESAGLKRAISFGIVIEQAVAQGRLDGVKILGIWYATNDAAARYLSRTKIAQEMLDEGYVLLKENTPNNEYSFFKNLPRDRTPVERRNGRLYIKPDDLAQWVKTRRKAKPPRISPPRSGLLRLVRFAKTRVEYEQLIYAAQSGKLHTEKTGRWYFTSQEDVDAFLASKEENLAPSGTIFQEQA